MGDNKVGLRIGRKAFIQSAAILLALMIAAGLMTVFIPGGSYQKELIDGRSIIVPGSFEYTGAPHYPVWRWFTAPVQALWGPDGLMIITIIFFIMFVGGAFAILDRAGVLKALIARVVLKMGGNKYRLLAVIIFLFMVFGAMLGIFEEVIPLVPIMIALSFTLGRSPSLLHAAFWLA